ncbi:MAG TPA: ATP-binding protein, partial [Rhodopila sp.]|nr:ATP-binding protein [Rhodopila sp.]
HHAFAVVRGLAVKRAFVNLLDNALTYGGAVRVALWDTGSTVIVRMDDDGPGIPEPELERVFEPFHRLDASRNRRTGGVGLGLAIVRQAIAREGGSVRLANRLEGGLRAEVIMPTGNRPAPDGTGQTGRGPGRR